MRLLDISRVDVLHVARAEVSRNTPPGLWPCSACGRGYPVHQGWLIDYYHRPTHQAARAYVCAACARAAEAMRADSPGRTG